MGDEQLWAGGGGRGPFSGWHEIPLEGPVRVEAGRSYFIEWLPGLPARARLRAAESGGWVPSVTGTVTRLRVYGGSVADMPQLPASQDVLAVEGPVLPQVRHQDGCTRAPCGCYGITAAVHETDESVLAIRLVDDGGEVVGTARLLVMQGMLVLAHAATYRSTATVEWALHHQVVTELLLREAVRVADERGMALATSIEEPSGLLTDLGFARAGTVMRRDKRG